MKTLYKYQPINKYSISNIVTSKYYFPSPNEFNDPFDSKCNLIVEGTDEEFLEFYRRRGIKDGNEKVKQYREASIETKSKILIETQYNSLEYVGVFCLSQINNSILMYSHYADKHKGVCLQFCFDEKKCPTLKKVRYSPDRSLETINLLGQKFEESIVTTKSNIWEYESEWRLLNLTTERLVNFPTQVLTGIIFGCKTSSEDEELIRILMKSRDIKFYRAVMSEHVFELRIQDA